MKTWTKWMEERHRRWIACALAGLLLLQVCDPTASAFAKESLSENNAERETVSAETAMQESVPENSVSENTVSENSISENALPEENAGEAEDSLQKDSADMAEESVSENATEESVSENTAGESVSENTAGESVSENTTEESASENTAGESVSENTAGESVSENATQESVSANTMRVDSMAAAEEDVDSLPPKPTIKSVVPKDTTAEIHFTHSLTEEQAKRIQYEVQIRDEVKGVDLQPQEQDPNAESGSVVTIKGYDGKLLNTFRISGLAANKKYSVILRAKYGDVGEIAASAKKTFTTKKDMIATDGTMKIHYADMEALKNDPARKPEAVPENGVEMKAGESCALYAQVSRLMRAVETDKLKWMVTSAGEDTPENGLKVKASKSTYEAVLTAEKPGSYQVTATNTLSKETVSVFQVTVKAAQ